MAQITLSGGCLCGSVRYEITGDVRVFQHCHCWRCRKATGTGHASNIIMVPESITWVSGEELMRSYKVPGAERFRTVFCGECGSHLPRTAPDMSMAVVPAGSLDDSPGISPTARIFWDSRADWSCDPGNLPVWPEYAQQK